MKYKVGDYVRVSFCGQVVDIDDGDPVYPYRINNGADDGYWVSENDIESVAKPAFSIDEVINDGFGSIGTVRGVNYVPQNQSYQYKVNGVWFNEQELLEANK